MIEALYPCFPFGFCYQQIQALFLALACFSVYFYCCNILCKLADSQTNIMNSIAI